jgi:hypothetical protein
MDEDEARMEFEEDSMENSFQKVFGWYLVLNRIASNDFTKHDHIYEKTIMEVLNQLNFLVQYDKEQERLQKKAMERR